MMGAAWGRLQQAVLVAPPAAGCKQPSDEAEEEGAVLLIVWGAGVPGQDAGAVSGQGGSATAGQPSGCRESWCCSRRGQLSAQAQCAVFPL
jgi:hypothetical protein